MTDIFIHTQTQKNIVNSDRSVKPQTIDIPSSKPGMFSSFSLKPLSVSFQNQEEEEEILLFLRPHFITNLFWITTTLFLIFVPFAVYYFSSYLNQFILISLPDRYIILITSFYYLFVLGYILVNFMAWFYNIFIVTQIRVVDIDYSDIVYHNVAMTKLDLAQDVDYTQSGFIRSFFNYGDIVMRTAGKNAIFDALAVPNPAQVTKTIEDLIGKEETSVP